MTDTVAVPKPGKAKTRNGKTLVAGLLVIVLFAAFAAAFYLLGGVELVSSALGGLFASNTPATSAPGGSNAAVPATSSAEASGTGALKLPVGVDEPFAKRMYVEQLESEENIAKLVTGKVDSISFGASSTVAGGTEIRLVAQFKDKTSGKGTLGLAQRAGSWFFVFLRGERGANTNGEADTVSPDTKEDFASNQTPLNNTPVDVDVLNTILEQQMKSQDAFKGIVDGTYAKLKVDKVTQGPGTATLEVTLTGPKNAAMKGRILCISKDIDGKTTWFVTSFMKA